MKSLILFFTLSAFGITAMAQGTTKEQSIDTKTTQPVGEKKTPPTNEYVKMMNGKLLHFKGTTKTEIAKGTEVKLGETIVKADGTVMMKDGTTSKLKEGNIVNVQGKVLDVAAMRMKAAEQKPVQQKPVETKPSGE